MRNAWDDTSPDEWDNALGWDETSSEPSGEGNALVDGANTVVDGSNTVVDGG